MKTWLIIVVALTLFSGSCATLDSARTAVQGQVCPECRPVVVEKITPCPEVQLPTPAPKAAVKSKAGPKKATPKIEDPYLNGVTKDKAK